MRAIFAAVKSENERKMLLVWTSTVCRPGQILDLTGDRIDLDEHSIDFRVPDATITKKRRAKVVMCPSVHAYLAALGTGPFGLQHDQGQGHEAEGVYEPYPAFGRARRNPEQREGCVSHPQVRRLVPRKPWHTRRPVEAFW
jgi:hypothetical protein